MTPVDPADLTPAEQTALDVGRDRPVSDQRIAGGTGAYPLLRQIEVRRTQNGWWQVREVGVRVIVSKRDERAAREIANDLEWAADVLDLHLPKRGQCLLCGTPGEDQTHRVIDAIAGAYRAGDDEIDLAVDYGVEVEAVSACLIWTAPERHAGASRSDDSSTTTPLPPRPAAAAVRPDRLGHVRRGTPVRPADARMSADLGDGMRARVEELEQRIAVADDLLFRMRPPEYERARSLVDDVRQILRGDL